MLQHSKIAFGALALFLNLLLSLSSAFAQETTTVDVRFPAGTSGTTVNGSITGYENINYRLGVSAGQIMSVQLDASNASTYFNITAPGASEALYNGSISGNGTSVVIPSSGNYTIQVYLMRNAARRNEIADFALTFHVENAATTTVPAPMDTGPANAVSNGISTDLMPRYCAGEASAKFGVRPQEITTDMAFRSGNNYVSQGYFGSGNTTFFNCYFSLDGRFLSVN